MQFICLLAFASTLCVWQCLANPTKRYNDQTSECWKKYEGVCVSKADPCPFINGTNLADKDEDLCANKERRCCVAPTRRDIYKREGKCGLSYFNKGSRIHGGIQVMPKEYPWQVSLQYFKNKHCGGTILNEQWILTAAHCTYFYERDVANWQIVAGSTDLSVTNGKEQVRNISRIVEHTGFHNPRYIHDIALLKLSKPLQLNRYVNTACLPEQDESFQNMVCHVSGFGATENSTTGSDVLLKTSKPVVDSRQCQLSYCFSKPVYTTNICGGFKSGERDACQGDSGGPFVCRKKDNEDRDRYILAGIVSHGGGCAVAGKPGIYTRVEDYLDWIAHIVNEKPGNPPEVKYEIAAKC